MATEAAASRLLTVREPLDWRTLDITRVIAHQLFKHDKGADPIAPTLSTKVTELPLEAITELEDRITKALGENAASLPIHFCNTDSDSAYGFASAVLSAADDTAFVDASKELALLLAEAQRPRNPPGGILLILQATLKRGTLPIALIIKAEATSGFGSKDAGGEVEIEVIKDLFLTQRQAVYKVAALAKSARLAIEAGGNGDIAWLFDSNLTRRDAKVRPADYFIDGFLSAEVTQTGATDTADFYRAVTAFANEADISDQQKIELAGSLNTFLDRPEVDTFTVAEFIDTSVPEELQDAFDTHMTVSDVPRQGIKKDTSHIQSLLKRSSMEFTSKVTIRYPTGDNPITVLREEAAGTVVRIPGKLKIIK